MKIAYITAGAAGMYCGTCLHDNTLAAALMERGHEVSLTPGSILGDIYGERRQVNSLHHQTVAELGTGLRVTATADDGTVEGLELGQDRIVGGQTQVVGDRRLERLELELGRHDPAVRGPVAAAQGRQLGQPVRALVGHFRHGLSSSSARWISALRISSAPMAPVR